MPSFRSELFAKWASDLGIKLNFSAPNHPISHAHIEKTNSVISQMLKKFIHDYGSSWNDLLPYLLFAIRTARNEGTGYSADELVFGRHLRTELEVQRDSWENNANAEETLKISAVDFVRELQKGLRLHWKRPASMRYQRTRRQSSIMTGNAKTDS